ncbi:MAG: peptidoglycan bridge formation glycyltransferase FemA/FemB family protein [Anaerolineaceae bacterium]|nr:peptidoglycan bridge formation glycyltransferase FemA/FemB family protein [Anaerolineaceae bacterium]
MGTQYNIAENTHLDCCEWNNFVLNHPQGHRMQTSVWAETKARTGWNILYLTARQHGELVGGGQLYERRIPLIGSLVCLPKGPLCTTCQANPNLLPGLISQAQQWVQANHKFCLLVQPADQSQHLVQHLLSEKYVKLPDENIVPPGTIIIDLEPDQETLFKNMNKTKRRNIRRAQSSGVVVKVGTSREDLNTFYNLYLATSRYLEFEPDDKARFENIWNCLSPEGHVMFFTSFFEDQPLSSIMALSFGDSIICYRFGWSKEHPEKRPNDFLHWEALLWAKENGYRYFDFGEIELDAARKMCDTGALPEEYLYTSVSFKLNFGGKPILYPETYIYFPNPVVRWLYVTFITKLIDFPPVQRILSGMSG